MSVMSLLHAKDFTTATTNAKKLLAKKAASQSEIDAALSSHPGNPANAPVADNILGTFVPVNAVALNYSAPPIPVGGSPATNGYTTKEQVLLALKAGQIEIEIAMAYIQRFESAAVEAAKVRAPGKVYCKVSAKGAVSLYGVNAQFPVTLYAEQWERLPAMLAETILPFIKENEGKEFTVDAYENGKKTGKTTTCRITRKTK